MSETITAEATETPFALNNDAGATSFNIDTMPEMGILPKHNYRVVCTDIKDETSRNGNKMFVLDFEILSPDTVTDPEGNARITAKTKFRKWFVWSPTPMFSGNLKGLFRAFGLVKRNYISMDQMHEDVTRMMIEGARGSSFLWDLYTEPQYKRELLTTEEKNAGKRIEDAAYILDSDGNKIVDRHNVIGEFNGVIGGFERI